MEKQTNRRKIVLITGMGVGSISALVAQKLASLSDSNTVVVVSPKEVEKEPQCKPIPFINYLEPEAIEKTKLIDCNSTGGTHKGGKKNKRNKRW